MIIKGYAGRQLFPKHTDTQIGFKIYSFMPNNEYIHQLSLNDYGNITIKGELPSLFNDKEYEIDVEFEVKNNYETYVVKRMISNPMEMNDKQSFNFLSEMVGEKLAYNILKEYPNFIQLIIKDKLEEINIKNIKGLGEKRLLTIKDRVKKNLCFFDIIAEFKEYEFTLKQVQNLYDAYSSFEKLKEKINDNPYKCLCSIAGIGFKKADKLILNKNRQLITSKFRMSECILYHLSENEQSGNTWMYVGELFSNCSNTTPECMGEFRNVIENYSQIYFDKDTKKVAKLQTFNYEKEIANTILSMLKAENKMAWNGVIYDKVNNVTLSDKQTEIQKVLMENNVCMLAGYGGTGKSFSTKAVCDMLDNLNYSYILLAPTGKASKNLAENTNRNASTIHRGLAYKPPEGFTYNQDNKLMKDVVIVDEATMIDVKLMVSLLRAIDKNNTKIMFICDPSQISSIGAGNCMQDLIDKIPTVTLDKVFRYEDGGMAKVATDTREGKQFLSDESIQKFGDDFCFVSANKDTILDKVLSAYKKMLGMGGTVDTISIISAYNKGDFGTYNINSMIQDYINPSKNQEEMSYTREKQLITFRIGDRVMQTVNNYKAEVCDLIDGEWLVREDEAAIFNGDDGKIIDIKVLKNGTKIMIVDFYGKNVMYKGEQIRDLLLGYSISAHKSQGSSIPYVITVTPPPHKFFLNRNLLYVMYSRARKYVYSIGTIDTITSTLKKSENLSRQTFLGEMIKENK